MAVKSRGLGGGTVRHKDESAERRRGGLVAALHDDAPAGEFTVPWSEMVPNPDPTQREVTSQEDVSDLAASIRQVGILQPVILVAADEYATSYPQFADAVAGFRWVILAGHRRRLASLEAGVDEAPAVRRSADGADRITLHENFGRKELTPLEEARAFATQMERHSWSQRELAKQVPYTQAHISKRLTLLKLPEPVQAAVQSGALPSSRAVQLVSDHEPAVLDAMAQTFDPDSDAGVQARNAEMHFLEQKARAVAEQTARDEGATFLASPHNKFGARWAEHQLHGAKEVAEARERGDLAYSAPESAWANGDSGPVAWRLSVPEPKAEQQAKKVARKSAKDTEDREAKAARAARRGFLVQLVERKPATKECAAVVSTAILAGVGLGGQVTRLARKTAQAAGIGPALDADQDWDWRAAVAAVEQSATREHLAWIAALAALEDHTAYSYAGWWGDGSVRYVDYLRERGYRPTTWEQSHYDASVEHLREVAEEGDNSVITPADGDADNAVITPEGGQS